jgi:hypothetical protein
MAITSELRLLQHNKNMRNYLTKLRYELLRETKRIISMLLFPTRLLTSEDEYKWYWHQMIYFPETINTISTLNTISPTHSLVSS